MTDYYELARLADRVFAISDEDVGKLVSVLDTFEDELRFELLFSDFFNAYQVFYYFFRESPTELGEERLILEPASGVAGGVFVEERGILRLIFTVKMRMPVILAETDEGEVIEEFSGPTAYRDGIYFADSFD